MLRRFPRSNAAIQYNWQRPSSKEGVAFMSTFDQTAPHNLPHTRIHLKIT